MSPQFGADMTVVSEASPALFDSINNVIARLDDIIENCKDTGNRNGYFAALYRQVTIRVRGWFLKLVLLFIRLVEVGNVRRIINILT